MNFFITSTRVFMYTDHTNSSFAKWFLGSHYWIRISGIWLITYIRAPYNWHCFNLWNVDYWDFYQYQRIWQKTPKTPKSLQKSKLRTFVFLVPCLWYLYHPRNITVRPGPKIQPWFSSAISCSRINYLTIKVMVPGDGIRKLCYIAQLFCNIVLSMFIFTVSSTTL